MRGTVSLQPAVERTAGSDGGELKPIRRRRLASVVVAPAVWGPIRLHPAGMRTAGSDRAQTQPLRRRRPTAELRPPAVGGAIRLQPAGVEPPGSQGGDDRLDGLTIIVTLTVTAGKQQDRHTSHHQREQAGSHPPGPASPARRPRSIGTRHPCATIRKRHPRTSIADRHLLGTSTHDPRWQQSQKTGGAPFLVVLGPTYDSRTRMSNSMIGAPGDLLVLSVRIAIIGIVSTMTLSILERQRELALPRVVGMLHRRVRRMVPIEVASSAAPSTVSGRVLGTLRGQDGLRRAGVGVPGRDHLAVVVGPRWCGRCSSSR